MMVLISKQLALSGFLAFSLALVHRARTLPTGFRMVHVGLEAFICLNWNEEEVVLPIILGLEVRLRIHLFNAQNHFPRMKRGLGK